MYKRKYATYEVVVVGFDGSKSEFKYDGIGSEYKAMLDQYKTIKEKFSEDKTISNIDFVGISEDGKMNVIHTKQMNNKENNKETPVDVMNEQLNIIKDYKNNFGNYEQWLEKKMNEFKHRRERIKFLKSEEEKNNERIKISIEEEQFLEERRIFKNRWEASYNMDLNNFNTKNINMFNKLWNRKWDKDEITDKIYCYREKFNSEEEKQILIDKLIKEGYNKILQLPNNYIGYYKTIYRNKKSIKVDDTNIDNLAEECNDVKIEETTLDTNCIKTITMNEKLPREKGSCIQIKYKSMKEKMKIIKEQHDKYERCENIADKSIIRLMYRKTA